MFGLSRCLTKLTMHQGTHDLLLLIISYASSLYLVILYSHYFPNFLKMHDGSLHHYSGLFRWQPGQTTGNPDVLPHHSCFCLRAIALHHRSQTLLALHGRPMSPAARAMMTLPHVEAHFILQFLGTVLVIDLCVRARGCRSRQPTYYILHTTYYTV